MLNVPETCNSVKWELDPLPREFYARLPEVVARDIIGKHIVRVLDDERRMIARIVEAEGYRGQEDPASHAFRGPTARNYPMFGPPGHAYVYFIYGMHWMFNISAHPPEMPGAILIRAAEPVLGTEWMAERRKVSRSAELTNGPAKLAQALEIDGTLNGLDLCQRGPLFLVDGSLTAAEEVMSGPRIRVPGDAVARHRPWRFWIKDNPYVSR